MLIQYEELLSTLGPQEKVVWEEYQCMAKELADKFATHEESQKYTRLTLDVLQFSTQSLQELGHKEILSLRNSLRRLGRTQLSLDAQMLLVHEINESLASLISTSRSIKNTVQGMYSLTTQKMYFIWKDSHSLDKQRTFDSNTIHYDFVDKLMKLYQIARAMESAQSFDDLGGVKAFVAYMESRVQAFLDMVHEISTADLQAPIPLAAVHLVQKYLSKTQYTESQNFPEFTLTAFVLALLLKDK